MLLTWIHKDIDTTWPKLSDLTHISSIDKRRVGDT
jgi:hypothetical protein